jgi:S-formylglutathione hydrolase FrmB
MLVAGGSALKLAAMHPNPFLFAVGCSASTSSSPAGAPRLCATGGPGAAITRPGRR